MSNNLQKLKISVIIFSLTLAIYTSSRDTIPNSDSRWSVYVALSVIREGNTDLDEYAELINSTNNFAALEVDGHLRSLFPLGTPLLAIPVVFAADRFAPSLLNLDLHEHMRLARDNIAANLELVNASLIAAAACVVIYWIGRLYLNRVRSLVLVFIFAFCTSMWSTASRALWQHGPSVLMLSLTLYILLLAEMKPRLVQFASLPLAYAYVVRPTNSISVLFLTAYVFIAFRRYFLNYLFWSALIAIPFVLSNFIIYDNLLAPYYLPGRLELFGPTFLEALAGNMVSPARGLLIYSPIFLLSIYGIFLKIKKSQFNLLDMALIAILFFHWLIISSFPHWYGGYSFGPRFFSDMLPYLIYFLIPVLAVFPSPLTFRTLPLSILFMILLLFSFFIHLRGATQPNAALEWNRAIDNVVENVDSAPQRIWDWSDPQFLRGLRPARLSALKKTPFFVLKENEPTLLQLALINNGDKMLALDTNTPSRISFIGDDDPENLVLEGMTSRELTFSIDTTGIPAGQYSLGGIYIEGQNSDGTPVAGSPMIIPVSIEILSNTIDMPPQFQHVFHLPIVFKSPTAQLVDHFVAPVDILINGQSQASQTRALRSVFGTGWYDFEQVDNYRWRWARSPAHIYIYSDFPQVVQFTSTIVTLPPDPTGSEKGQDLIIITTNDQNSSEQLIVKNQPFTVNTELHGGWNVISLALSAGNFIPAEIDPQTGDGRELSFAVNEINIVGEDVEKDNECCYP
jgi:hypothetical protein